MKFKIKLIESRRYYKIYNHLFATIVIHRHDYIIIIIINTDPKQNIYILNNNFYAYLNI